MTSSRYDLRGVSASKEDVHKAIKNLDKGLFKNSFCKILPDILTGDSDYCLAMHADTAGTKTSLCYAYWKETGAINVWQDIVQDAIVMNIDDLACSGICDNIIISNTIGRNKHLIPGEVIENIISGINLFISRMKQNNVNITLAGGETADVGDIVRTIDIGVTAFARMPRNKIIKNNIMPDDVIVGLSSSGQSTYENIYNSGIGSNGLTSARHDMFSSYLYNKYPETFDPGTPKDLVYCGTKKLSDLDKDTGMSYGQLLLSPTRTFLPVIKSILEKYFDSINGIIHCTGGGQTKVLNFVNNIHVVKDNLFKTPKIFQIIQENSSTSWQEMYKVFNMGHRIELYLEKEVANNVIDIANKFNIDAQIIGYCKPYNGKKLTIDSKYGNFEY
ncbi:MAG: phosphoribosylformylglycinamidine cyclo-ligase [Flavobacteriales bacterium]|nr:phosphoribosylformylglycinamidine cyclo-ligase [Flavobacteriales bacterium]